MTTCNWSSQPEAPRARPHDLRASCVRFGRLLRARGLPVGPEQVTRWLRALDLTGLGHPADLFWTGRLTLVSHQAHLEIYDEQFRQFWLLLDQPALDPLRGQPGAVPRHEKPQPAATERTGSTKSDARWQVGAPYLPPGAVPEEAQAPPAPATTPATGWYSDLELLRDKDFAAYTEADGAALARLLERDTLWLEPLVRSRRTRPFLHGNQPDLRRTVREAIRFEGEPLAIRWRERKRQWRKWIFLCDISASMTPYVTSLLLFAQAIAARRRATEVFVFGTRLTRVTPYLRRQRPGRLTARLAPVRDWQGGTRLGESLEQFLRIYGRRGMAHGAVLFVLSDGLDLGRPGLTGQMMERLGRIAARVAWINPLKRSAGYTPTARAMAEALPHVDDFAGGHTLGDLTALIRRQAEADR